MQIDLRMGFFRIHIRFVCKHRESAEINICSQSCFYQLQCLRCCCGDEAEADTSLVTIFNKLNNTRARRQPRGNQISKYILFAVMDPACSILSRPAEISRAFARAGQMLAIGGDIPV